MSLKLLELSKFLGCNYSRISTFMVSKKYFHFTTEKQKNVLNKNLSSELSEKIKSTIKIKGPITIAEYMQTILTHQSHGYYMNKDVFGEKGDFITSPEISQIFGELVGVWLVNEWMNDGGKVDVDLVELGPGRGTLMVDILRVFSKFPELHKRTSVRMVEVSPHLKQIQVHNLCGEHQYQRFLNDQESKNHNETYSTKDGVEISWHQTLSNLPPSTTPSSFHPSFHSSTDSSLHLSNDPSLYPFTSQHDLSNHPSMASSIHPTKTLVVAHEFFDALPIHKFQKVGGKWREVLVGMVDDRLQMITSTSDTVAKALLAEFLEKLPSEQEHAEISPASLQYIKLISSCIDKDGSCLIIDYGHMGDKHDTFRAFSKHRLVDPLESPGSCDLTADVNFKQLLEAASRYSGVKSFGPVNQSSFLQSMGVDVRLKVLLSKAKTDKERNDLISGYKMISEEGGMGGRFKVLALKNSSSTHVPAAF